MEKVILASTNPAKVEAVKKVFESLGKPYELISLDVESGVSKTPLSDEEGIAGCLQRIESAKKINPEGDIYLGLEGIISSNKFASFICGWAVVDWVNLKRKGMSCGAKVELPKKFAQKIKGYDELSEVIKKEYPSKLVSEMKNIGANGVISNGFYTRVNNFSDALRAAIGYILNDANWLA